MKDFKLKEADVELSDVPSEAIAQCMRDLEACEKHPDYGVYMGVWHLWDKNEGRCEVCMGGAHMARELDDPRNNLEGNNSPSGPKIESMDVFRHGAVWGGLQVFFETDNKGLKEMLKKKVGGDMSVRLMMYGSTHRRPEDYEMDPAKFKLAMGGIVRELRACGL